MNREDIRELHINLVEHSRREWIWIRIIGDYAARSTFIPKTHSIDEAIDGILDSWHELDDKYLENLGRIFEYERYSNE